MANKPLSPTMYRALRYFADVERFGGNTYGYDVWNVWGAFFPKTQTIVALIDRGLLTAGSEHTVTYDGFLTLIGNVLDSKYDDAASAEAREVFAYRRKAEIEADRAREAGEKRAAALAEGSGLKVEPAPAGENFPKPELPKRVPPEPAPEIGTSVHGYADAILKRLRDGLADTPGYAAASSFEFKTADEPDLCGYPLFPPYRCGLPKNHAQDKHEVIVSPWLPGLPFDQETADSLAADPTLRVSARFVIENFKRKAAAIEGSLDSQLLDILTGEDDGGISEDLAHELTQTNTERGRKAFDQFREVIEVVLPGHGEMCNHAHDYGTRISFCTNLSYSDAAHVLACQAALVKASHMLGSEFGGIVVKEVEGYVFAIVFTAEDEESKGLI